MQLQEESTRRAVKGSLIKMVCCIAVARCRACCSMASPPTTTPTSQQSRRSTLPMMVWPHIPYSLLPIPYSLLPVFLVYSLFSLCNKYSLKALQGPFGTGTFLNNRVCIKLSPRSLEQACCVPAGTVAKFHESRNQQSVHVSCIVGFLCACTGCLKAKVLRHVHLAASGSDIADA